VFDLMGFPVVCSALDSRSVMKSLTSIAAEGRIYVDSGSYRESLIVRDERAE
jgi:hypothetical protein